MFYTHIRIDINIYYYLNIIIIRATEYFYRDDERFDAHRDGFFSILGIFFPHKAQIHLIPCVTVESSIVTSIIYSLIFSKKIYNEF